MPSPNTAELDVIAQVVLHERQGRDRGWWDQMRACYWPDSTVRLSWYTGSGPGFVDASEAMVGRGDLSTHRLSPPVVQAVGDRAFVEVPAAIEVRTTSVDDVEVDIISYARIVYRLERRSARWAIVTLDPVYERDTLTPVLPGQRIDIAPAEIARFRPPFAFLAWHLSRRGYSVGTELLGDDQPDRVTAFYSGIRSWLTTP